MSEFDKIFGSSRVQKKKKQTLSMPDKKKHKKKPASESRFQESLSSGLEEMLDSDQHGQSFFASLEKEVAASSGDDADMSVVEENETASMDEEDAERYRGGSPNARPMTYDAPKKPENFKVKRPQMYTGKYPVLLNDDECFTFEDFLAKRELYKDCREMSINEYNAKARILCLNFTAETFMPGASKWFDLKDLYFEFLMSVFNSLQFATGKKIKLTPSEKVTDRPVKSSKKRMGANNEADDGDSEEIEVVVTPLKTTPQTELSNFLAGDKLISVFVETLVSVNVVIGFRWWIFDRVDSKTGHDILSLGLRESLLEADKIRLQAKKEMEAVTKANSNSRSAKAKKAATAKQYGIAKEFSFSNYNSFDSHYTGLVKRYFTKDPCLAVTGNNSTNAVRKRQFRDTRPFMDYDTLTRSSDPLANDFSKENHPCNLSRLLSKESAMFYYVGAENVDEAQCRLESYFKNANGGRVIRAKETAHTRRNYVDDDISHSEEEEEEEGDLDGEMSATRLVDVADHSQSARDCDFIGFLHPNITYHVDTAFLSYECMSRMPLPHRLGVTLYTQKDMTALKKASGYKISHTEAMEAGIEGTEQADLVDTFSAFDLHEQDEASHIFGASASENVLQFGGVVLRFMGLYQTEPEVTKEILLARPQHLDVISNSYLKYATVPKDVIDKFVKSVKNEVSARLKLILKHMGPTRRSVIAETRAAVHAQQEDMRNKSLSSMMMSAQLGDGRDGASHIMDQLTHFTNIEDSTESLIQLPYMSFSKTGIVRNANKTDAVKKKADQINRRRIMTKHGDDFDAMDEETRNEQIAHEERDYKAKVSSGNPAYFKEFISEFRPYGNSLYVLKTELPSLEVEEVFLGRDIGLREAENNRYGYTNLAKKYYNPEDGKLPVDKEDAYLDERKKYIDAAAVIAFHEFKTNRNVSYACEGIRGDLMKRKVSYIPPDAHGRQNGSALSEQTYFGTMLPVHEPRQELRLWGEFRTWVQALFANQFGIAYNYKIMWITYVASKHHCRFHPFCNSPKLNLILGGNGMVGKSHILQSVKRILPTGVGDMVTHITDQAFNVDRNMNDMLLIYEEMQNKYFGYSGGNKDGGGSGGTSAGSDSDTTNFFKARLTSGATSTMSWFENEETGMRDMKISKAHCQGNLLCASNNCFTDADANVMTRFILLTVPKSKSQHEGERPQDKKKDQYGTDSAEDNTILEQHKEIHRIYFLVEQMVKARVLEDNVYGVNCDGGRIMRDLILDHLQKRYGINTNDVRKRDYILEMARCMAMLQAVWYGLTSKETRKLQYDPHDPERFIGFNVRVLTEGIFPFLVVTKDHIIDAITSLSSIWYHDYQDVIVESFATHHCHLQELRASDFLVRSKTQAFFHHMNASNSGVRPKRRALSTSALNASADTAFGNAFGVGGHQQQQQQDEKEVDYNYIVMRGKNREAICHSLSISLGDMIVATNDISKLLQDLSKCIMENVDSYDLKEFADEKDANGEIISYKKKLVRDTEKKTMNRAIVEFATCPLSGAALVALNVHWIRQKYPALFKHIIDDLKETQSVVPVVDEMMEDPPPRARDPVVAVPVEVMEVEEKSPQDVFEAKIRAIGMISMEDETLIIKSFKDVFQNMVTENPGMDEEELRQLEDGHRNPITGIVPWRQYITADSPKNYELTHFHPELKASLDKLGEPTPPIRFVSELKMLVLKRDPLGKPIVIRNHNTVSASARATSSIHKPRSKQLVKRVREDGTEVMELGPGEVLKKARIEEYGHTDAWELDIDIDAVFCREHLLNLGMPRMESKPQYELFNYPPCTYIMTMEDRTEQDNIESPLLEYPFVNNRFKIFQKEKLAKGTIDPSSIVHPNFSKFMLSNHSANGRIHKAATSRSLFIGKPIPNRCLETDRANRDAVLKEMML